MCSAWTPKLELLHPRHRPNLEKRDRLFLPTPKTRTPPVIISFANAIYDDNHPPGHFPETSEGILNFPYNNYGILSTVVGWIRNWRLDWKHAHFFSFIQDLYKLLVRELHPPEKYIWYITTFFDQAPHLELFPVRRGIIVVLIVMFRDARDFSAG